MLALTAVALILTNAIPAGWMPAKSADGHFVVGICSQGLSEPQRLQLEALAQQKVGRAMLATDHHSDGEHQQPTDPCPYGVAANALAVPSPLAPAAEFLPRTETAPTWLYSNVDIGTGLAAPPPPSTGPPLFS